MLEVVGEVARAPDKVWRHPGPDGRSLRLLHRDIEPGNIQVTPTGEVKILDFGIARAEFDNREAKTTRHIGGTFGYIAPERLHGEELPAGDVYSLGVVLQELLTGALPDRANRTALDALDDHPVLGKVIDLAREMQALDPEERPTAREVERRCEVLRVQCDPPRLRDWAEKATANVEMLPADHLVGSVLTETISNLPRMPNSVPKAATTWASAEPEAAARPTALIAALAGGAVLLVLVLVGVTAAAVGGGMWWWTGGGAGTVPVAPVAEADAAGGDEAAGGGGVSAPAEDTTAKEPDATSPEPPPVTPPKPAKPAPPAKAAPTPPPAPAPAPPAGPTYPVTFTSMPFGADVSIDGVAIGRTPIAGHPLPAGAHTVRMTVGDDATEQTIQVGSRAPTRYTWTPDAETPWKPSL